MAEQWRQDESARWAILDPAGEPPETVFTTVYVGDELLLDEGTANTTAFQGLERLAGLAGWSLERIPLEDPRPARPKRKATVPSPGASRTVRVRIGVADNIEADRIAETPDAWQLLRQARHNDVGVKESERVAKGLSLNHVVSTDPFTANPFTANPFTANPFTANPFTANPFTANPFTANPAGMGLAGYSVPGFGGRQPIAYVGAEPQRTKAKRRPVVAVFDTGCGAHPWLAGDVLIDPTVNGQPIGNDDPATDPEKHPRRSEPLDGLLDPVAGHGTFIAGLVRQQCPDARLLPVRVADGRGFILENELIGALGRLIEFMADTSVDVLNLSLSYYHESPGDSDTVSELASLLAQVRSRKCIVVCSAGNDATDRPTYPAALPGAAVPGHIAVGALNPANHSVALFSNVGDWVDVYAPGVSLVSTIPVDFSGSAQAGVRDDRYARRRQTLDPDDFRGGFAVWSGTSFAAPIVAGRIAQHLCEGAAPAKAVSRVVRQLESEDTSPL